MWYTANNRRALDDIVFRGRNRAYGAYVLRAEYEKTLFRALFLVMLGVASFSISIWLLTRGEPGIKIEPEQIYVPAVETTVDLREPLEKKDASPAPKKRIDPLPPSNNNAATAYTISAEDNSRTDSLADTPPSPEPSAGTGSSATIPSTGGNVAGNADGETGNAGPFESYDAVIMPEFDGGVNALRRFVANNVRYPESFSSMNPGGLVMVRFVVDEKGNISGATIRHSAGYDFDKEALRVVKILPRFKSPGIFNGKPVKVYYDLPIRFK